MTGVLLALLVESAHWIRVRWNFDEQAYGRAWHLTTIAIAIASVLILLDGSPYSATPTLITWLPPLLLPMQFVQSFGLADSMPLDSLTLGCPGATALRPAPDPWLAAHPDG